MYYLHHRGRGSQPTPSDAPYSNGPNSNNFYEWSYSLGKHREALKHVKGGVDNSIPRGMNPAVQQTQVATRKFYEDARRAEIGRANRKLVERLNTIARGAEGVYDPRSPPRLSDGKPCVHYRKYERGLSLTENSRRKAQRTIDENNAALVRRILHTKCTFDRAGDEEAFQQHVRSSAINQRLPDKETQQRLLQHRSRSAPRLTTSMSLPRLDHSKVSASLQGLDMLFMPGELRRGSGLLDRAAAARAAGSPSTAAIADRGGGSRGGSPYRGQASGPPPRGRSRSASRSGSHSRSRSGSRRSRSGSGSRRSRSRSGSRSSERPPRSPESRSRAGDSPGDSRHRWTSDQSPGETLDELRQTGYTEDGFATVSSNTRDEMRQTGYTEDGFATMSSHYTTNTDGFEDDETSRDPASRPDSPTSPTS